MAPEFTWRTIAKGHLLLAVPDPSRKVITAHHPTKFRHNERLNTIQHVPTSCSAQLERQKCAAPEAIR